MNKQIIPKGLLSLPEHYTVEKKVLSNGMVVLVRSVHTIPKVSIQVWYGVGSKNEKDKERGIAHLIEHMLFKGTNKLSESDINVITQMLSGTTNAFTSYDFTGYLFNLPSQHWQEAFTIMADTMCNAAFKEDHLTSEMKAVVQELKMFRDDYLRTLLDEMISVIFSDHPYHHPIIGYKQDLWSVNSDDLREFYCTHYIPNNAVLVVVGDVKSQEVFKLAQEKFGNIPPNLDYQKEQFYFNQDVISKTVTLYRDIKQPIAIYTFLVPGIRSHKDNVLQLLTRIIGRGKSSRLYHILVNETQLASSVTALSEELFDHGLFFIICEPKSVEIIPEIEKIIVKELKELIEKGFGNDELERSIKQTEMALYTLLENLENQAFEIGKYYVATQDPNYVFNYLNEKPATLKKEMQDILATFFRKPLMHKGYILPLAETEKDLWGKIQDLSEEEDRKILAARIRETEVEPPKYAHEIVVKEPGIFNFPKPHHFSLKNGLKVLYYDNEVTPKIDIILTLKAKYFYDPKGKEGIGQFVSKMMLEGTKNYTAKQLAAMIEQRGISLSAFVGGLAMSLLSEDLPFALGILQEILTNATFPEKEMEKVRAQMLSKIDAFWDEPRYFSTQLVKEKIYADHPYSKNSIGTVDSIKNITQQDLIDYYKRYISPNGASIAIVGDIPSVEIFKNEVENYLSTWRGPDVETMTFPSLSKKSFQVINYPINRDQIVLRFAGLSIPRFHPDFDKLLIFDQIFGGGALGSMASKLFQLRERSGLFYTIGGSTISGSDEQPGMISISTIVSRDRLSEAEDAIKKTIETADQITEKEFEEARNAIINSLVDNFSSNYNIAQAFLFLDRFNLSHDYFDMRASAIKKITFDEVKSSIKKYLNLDKLLILRVGRIGEND